MISITYDTHNVSLSGPQYGDIFREIQAYLVSSSLGGDLHANDANRPHLRTLEYSFHGLCETDKDALVALIMAAIGHEITLTDYLGNTFDCYMSADTLEIIALVVGFDVRIQLTYVV